MNEFDAILEETKRVDEMEEGPGPLDELLTKIARKHLGFETLQTRKSDSLDFKDVSVWGVKDALLAAYEAGVQGL